MTYLRLGILVGILLAQGVLVRASAQVLVVPKECACSDTCGEEDPVEYVDLSPPEDGHEAFPDSLETSPEILQPLSFDTAEEAPQLLRIQLRQEDGEGSIPSDIGIGGELGGNWGDGITGRPRFPGIIGDGPRFGPDGPDDDPDYTDFPGLTGGGVIPLRGMNSRPVSPGIGLDDIITVRKTRIMTPARIAACVSAVRAAKAPGLLQCRRAYSELCSGSCTQEILYERLYESDPLTRLHTRQLIDDFDKSCLASSDIMGTLSTSPEVEAEILSRTGVLVARRAASPLPAPPAGESQADWERANRACADWIGRGHVPEDEAFPFCSAVAMNDNVIISARHCFFGRSKRTWGPAKQCLDTGRLAFRSAASPEEDVPLIQIWQEAKVERESKKIQDDHIAIFTGAPAGVKNGLVRRGGAEPFRQVLITALHPLVLPGKEEGVPDWRQRLRWSRNACVIKMANDSCIVTNCQTMGGSSGAPVWGVGVDAQGKSFAELIALHVQEGTEDASACGFWRKETPEDGNLAILTIDPRSP